jgi:glycosyltransferase involved in cell wall biosynthesis
MKKKQIHFWVPYPLNSAPSQRFRVEQYLPYLPDSEFSSSVFSFLDHSTWEIFYAPGNELKKIFGLVKGFLRRFLHLFSSPRAGYIFILREASPAGPPVFEWLLAKIFRKKIIFDFDDAIWIPGGEQTSGWKKFFKATWKVKHIIRWSYKVSAGNEFLCSYARQFNKNVLLMPTGVDTASRYDRQKNHTGENKVVIGWTGSHTTLHNLELIEKIIPELKKETDFDFLVISNKRPAWNFDFIFKKWEAATELDDLLKMDIGVMPLKTGPWFEGKCGFKLIQYHACGIPAVASEAGVNPKITLHGQTGFIARTPEDWKKYLRQLVEDAALRLQMGLNGRKHIEENFSLHRLLPAYISLFS